MVSQTWDGERVYFTSSLLSSWDKPGDEDEQFLKAFSWDGDDLEPLFEVDFRAEGLGRPHLMRFGSIDFYRGRVAGGASSSSAGGGGE
jgi:selenium-binding protein 1